MLGGYPVGVYMMQIKNSNVFLGTKRRSWGELVMTMLKIRLIDDSHHFLHQTAVMFDWCKIRSIFLHHFYTWDKAKIAAWWTAAPNFGGGQKSRTVLWRTALRYLVLLRELSIENLLWFVALSTKAPLHVGFSKASRHVLPAGHQGGFHNSIRIERWEQK